MTLGERLQAFIDSQGISNLEFERNSRLCNGYVRNVKEVIGSDKLIQILNAYPILSPSWLMMEIGPMLIESTDENVKSKSQNSTLSNFQSGFNNKFSLGLSSEVSALLSVLNDQMKQNERLIKLLEHIVFQGQIQSNDNKKIAKISPNIVKL